MSVSDKGAMPAGKHVTSGNCQEMIPRCCNVRQLINMSWPKLSITNTLARTEPRLHFVVKRKPTLPRDITLDLFAVIIVRLCPEGFNLNLSANWPEIMH